jgi:YHS domain-containing protein
MKTKDPVCGMEVDDTTEYRTQYKGDTYLFCSADCKDKFSQNPEQYAKQQQKTQSQRP